MHSLGQATTRLMECLTAALESDEADGLTVVPIALIPEALAGTESTPLRMRVRYLVYAGGPASVALHTLDRVLRIHQPFLVPEEVSSITWQALGQQQQPGLLFDVPVHFVRSTPTAPRVTSLPRLDTVSIRSMRGQVVTTGGVPLAGMRITTADGTATTQTDTRGNFVLRGIRADQGAHLVVTGRGMRLTAEVAVVDAEPVVITCEI